MLMMRANGTKCLSIQVHILYCYLHFSLGKDKGSCLNFFIKQTESDFDITKDVINVISISYIFIQQVNSTP